MEKFMTREEREKLSNRLVLNFGVLLCGALVMLYVYNFISAGYVSQAQNTVGIIAIIAAVLAVVFFVLGKSKYPKIKNYSAIFLGTAIGGAITFAPKLSFVQTAIPVFTAKTAVISVFLLMLAYLIVMAVITGITLKTHPEAPRDKKIQHAKGKKKKKKR